MTFFFMYALIYRNRFCIQNNNHEKEFYLKKIMSAKTKKSTYNPISPAVDQAARLLQCLGGEPGDSMGLTAICKKLHIHNSKGFSILNALSKYDLVTRNNATKTYSLGPALIPLARKAAEKLDIHTISMDYLQELADETHTSVLLGIICNDQFYIVGKYNGNRGFSVTIRQYQTFHITHGSHGKAVFAFLSPKEQQRIMDGDQLFFHGSSDNFDRSRFDQEILFCRQNGYAVDDGEMTPGVSAVSAPVFDHNNQVVAGIVSVGTFTRDRFEAFGKKIAAAGCTISRQAGAEL